VDLQPLGRALVALGLGIAAVGLAVMLLARTGLPRVPGDVVIQRPGLTVYLPVGTSILLSLVLSLVAWLWIHGRR
jgi:hypothetical protein